MSAHTESPTPEAQVAATFGDMARVTCISCPLQVEGIWGGRFFYFRARHGRWTLTVGNTLDAAVMASLARVIPRWAGLEGRPEPDDEVDAGTFGDWLRAQLFLCGP